MSMRRSALISAYTIAQPFQAMRGFPIVANRAPTTLDQTQFLGQEWIYRGVAAYISVQIAGNVTTWQSTAGGSTTLSTLTDTSNTVVSPTAGNIKLAGTANQITVTAGSSTLTWTLPSAITAPGSLTTTTTLASGTTITAGTGITATTGNIVASTGNITSTLGSVAAATTVTAGTGITATTGNIVASTGNITSTLGSIGAATTITAGTTITATLGAITATNGNFVGSTAGKGFLFNSPATSGAASGPVIVNGRTGQATFTTVSIAAAADLTLTITNSAITGASTQVHYSLVGTTTGSALSIKSVTNSAGSSAIVVTNGTGATTSTADITLTFLVLN